MIGTPNINWGQGFEIYSYVAREGVLNVSHYHEKWHESVDKDEGNSLLQAVCKGKVVLQ